MINKGNELVIVNSKLEELFKVDLKDMTFNSQLFYDNFFSKIKSKIEYKIINNINEKEVADYKKCVRVYDVISKLFEDIQIDINKKF
jgi:outer membrane lipoprotein-sorting protein